ncbi:MAG: hypothetical protein IIV29_01220 [Tidjanibacter sp.]|nr:hypothetical protein [Tidjanibacter sp.]
MKRAITLLLTLLCATIGRGQTGGEILSQMGAKLNAMGAYRIDFELEMPTATDTSKGYCVVEGERYVISIEDLSQGCDGQTQWTLNGQNREATFDTPRTDSRNLFDNPTKAFDFSEELFAVESVTTNKNGDWQLVLLPAEGVLDGIERVVVRVDKKSLLPTALGYDMAGIGLWINIAKIAPTSTTPTIFTPTIPEGYEVIDFR